MSQSNTLPRNDRIECGVLLHEIRRVHAYELKLEVWMMRLHHPLRDKTRKLVYAGRVVIFLLRHPPDLKQPMMATGSFASASAAAHHWRTPWMRGRPGYWNKDVPSLHWGSLDKRPTMLSRRREELDSAGHIG